jgi:sugar phosphate isomerase/epimerase
MRGPTCGGLGHANLGALYDAFHATIEEKDPVGC